MCPLCVEPPLPIYKLTVFMENSPYWRDNWKIKDEGNFVRHSNTRKFNNSNFEAETCQKLLAILLFIKCIHQSVSHYYSSYIAGCILCTHQRHWSSNILIAYKLFLKVTLIKTRHFIWRCQCELWLNFMVSVVDCICIWYVLKI